MSSFFKKLASNLTFPTVIFLMTALLHFSLGAWLFLTQNLPLSWQNWQSPFFLPPLALVGLIFIFFLQEKIVLKNQKNLLLLKKNRNRIAHLVSSKTTTDIEVEQTKPDQVILVKPGEIIPRDGIIESGTTSVDESAITGEFRPKLKKPSNPVYAASLNRDSEITIRLENDIQNDKIEKLIRWQDETLLQEPRLVKKNHALSQRLGLFFIAMANGAFFYHYLNSQNDFFTALLPAISLLYLIPLASIFTSKNHFRNFFSCCLQKRLILSRGDLFDKIAKVKTLFLNKTGTLTKGKFVYSQCFIEKGTNMGHFLSTLFSLEGQSQHPLAEAMETHPWHEEVEKFLASDFQNHPGLGICGNVTPQGQKKYFAAVGNLRFMKRHRFFISRDMKNKIDELEEIGDTVILCGFDRQVKGVISFSDILRKDVKKSLKRLQQFGIETSLMTGDTEKTVTQLMGKLGIKKIYSRCTPEEKSAKILKEKEGGQIVAMIEKDHENLNLSRDADLNLAFGTGIHFEKIKSDVNIMGNQFPSIADLFESAIKAARGMRWVLGSQVFLASVGTVACFLGWVTPLFAIVINLIWWGVSLISLEKSIYTSSSIS